MNSRKSKTSAMNNPEKREPGRPKSENPTADRWIQLRVTKSRKDAYVSASRAVNPPQKLTKWVFDTLDKAAGYTPNDEDQKPQ